MPAKSKKAKKPTPNKADKATLPKIRTLLVESGKFLKQNPKLLWIAAIVLIPSRLVNAANTGELSAFAGLATVLMNLALIWAIIEISKGHKITVKDSYLKGTAAFVRFLLVASILVVMMLPLVIALSIVGLGILPASALLAERMLLAVVAVVLGAPTIFWLTRYALALFAVCESEIGPIGALRISGRMVRGNWLPVAKRLAVIAVLMSLIASLPLIWISFTKTVPNQWAIAVVQWISGIIGLPYLSIYLHRIYRSLDGQAGSR